MGSVSFVALHNASTEGYDFLQHVSPVISYMQAGSPCQRVVWLTLCQCEADKSKSECQV